MGLNNKQQAFVDEYVQCWNATEAAERAGYSEKTAYSIGQRLLKHVEVDAEVQKRITENAMTADEALARLAEQARGSLADFLDGVEQIATINLQKAAAAGKLHLVKKLRYNSKGMPEIELYDSQSALSLIMKHLGLFAGTEDTDGKTQIAISFGDGRSVADLTVDSSRWSDGEAEQKAEKGVGMDREGGEGTE